MSAALFLFELLKMSKLTRGPLVLYHLPKYWSRKKIEAKNMEIIKKIKIHNFKIPRAHVYPQTTSKMPVKFQKHLLKAVVGLCSQGTYYYMHFHSTEAWKKVCVKS